MNKTNILYKEADKIILATRWDYTADDVKHLDKIIKKIKKDNKKIIVFGPNPEFDYKEEKFRFTKNNFTNYKKYIYEKNSSKLSDDEIKNLKSIYFDQLITNIDIKKVEDKLKNITEKNDIKFISLISIFCDNDTKTCEFLVDNSNEEIFRDYGRISREGFLY